MGKVIGVTQKSREQDVILKFVEYLSSDVITIIGDDGLRYSFRKFLFSGNWGLADSTGKYVILPALQNYSQLEFLYSQKVIVVGSLLTGWDVYSLNVELIKHFPPMPFSLVSKLITKKLSLF